MKTVFIVPTVLITFAAILFHSVISHADTASDLAKADAIVAAADMVATESFSHRGNELREKRTEVAKTRTTVYRTENRAEAEKHQKASSVDWTNTVFNTVEANDGLYADTVNIVE